MWRFSPFRWSRAVKSESTESLSSNDRTQHSASSSEESFQDCDGEPEVGSNCTVEEYGLSRLSLYPSLSTIASGAVSMDRESSGGVARMSYGSRLCEESHLLPAKRLRNSSSPKVAYPAGVVSQADISRTWSPDAYVLHGAASSSVETLNYKVAPASLLPKWNGCATSAYDVKPLVAATCTLAQQFPPSTNFERNRDTSVQQVNRELSSPYYLGNQSFNPGLAPASLCRSPAVCNDFRDGFHLDSANCDRKDSTVVLPSATHVETYTSRASSKHFGNSHMPASRTPSATICFRDRECNAVSSGLASAMAEKDISCPTAGGSSPCSRVVPVPWGFNSNHCTSFPPDINRSVSFPRSSHSCPSSRSDSSSKPAGGNEQSGSVKREAIPTSRPESASKCEKNNSGSGVRHSIREPWRSQDELIDESQRDEYQRVDPAVQAMRGTSGVPSQHSHIQGVKESVKSKKCNSAFFQEVFTEQILDQRKNWDSPVESEQWPPLTDHLRYLGTLDFSTKVFPILTTLRGKSLEETFTLPELKDIGRQPKEGVSQYLWYMDGCKGRNTTGLPPKISDAGTSNYLCHVKPTGELIFELLEEKKQASSLLQRTLGFDKVLKVKFDDELAEDGKKAHLMMSQLARRGIFVGLRRYQYFAHKASDKFEKKAEGTVKCFFVCTGSLAEADKNPELRRFSTVAEARCLFMHIHQTESIPKYIARMQLVLSKTTTIDLDWSQVNVREKMDLQCKDESGKELDGISTDGTGFISTDLARKIPTNMLNGRQKTEEDGQEDYPSLIQVRLFHEGAAFKGTLLASNALPLNTIKCYMSMKKVGRDEKVAVSSINSLEVVNTSRKPRMVKGVYTAKLSRDLIMLLTACGVPDYYFTDLVRDAIEKNYRIFYNDDVATDEVLEWETEKAEILLMMIAAGIPLDEPFLRKSLLDITVRKLEDFTTGRINLPDSFYLLGTADPTGTLKRNQVAITLSDGFVYCPKLLVYRAPGKHPGDIHVFEATCNSYLQSVIGDGKYVIYFSTQGPRPIAEEIGKGDLDGDRYWICKNTKLISLFKEYPCRWERPVSKPLDKMQKPAEIAQNVLENTLFKECMKARFDKTSFVGKLSNLWVQQMDGYLNPETTPERKALHLDAALKLVPLCYDALDASKTGYKVHLLDEPLPNVKMPHYMNIPGEEIYHSKSTPGQIYDLAKSEELRALPSYENFEPDEAFCVENYQSYYQVWEDHYKAYKPEMSRRVSTMQLGKQPTGDPSAPDQLYMKYRKELYGGVSSFKECRRLGTKEQQQVLQEASAIYAVVYASAVNKLDIQAPRLSFAWNVAGEALCTLYAEKQPGQILPWSSQRFRNVCKKKKKKSVSAARRLFSD